jgi:hypothetical protein
MSNWLREGNKLEIHVCDCPVALEVQHIDKGGIALTTISQSNEAPWEDIKTTMYLFGRELEVFKGFLGEKRGE